MMENILSKRNQRHLYIIDYLTTHKGWSNISLLADNLNCSYQSLSTDIKYLNDKISPYTINTSQKYGISLSVPLNRTVDFLYETLLEDSFEFNFMEFIFFDESLDLEDLADRLFVSSSTLTRAVYRLRKNLVPYQMTVSNPPSKISGNELLVRHFYMNYFLERYPNRNFPFPVDQVETIERLLLQIFDDLGFSLSYPQLEKLKIFSLVSLVRIKQDHQIVLPTDIRTEIEQVTMNIISDKELITALSEAFDLSFNPNIIYQMLVSFLNPDILLSVSDLYTDLTPKKEAEIKQIERFLESFKAGYRTTLASADGIIYALYNLKLLFIEHDFLFLNKKKQFADNIAEIAPPYTQMFSYLLQQTTPYGDVSLSKEFELELFHLMITKWPNLTESLNKSMKRASIGIFGEFDAQHSQFIADLLTEQFSYCATFTAIHASTLTTAKEFSTQYDLVITNFPNIEWLSPESYTIQLAPSDEDMIELKKIIYKISAEKTLASEK